ncbi:MAG TPA: ion channel [Steroidobacteraceae bacterium]|nr:ion channel [Steroidobacteraceae bacterium]
MSPGILVWSRRLRSRAYRATRMQRWFPHGALALLVAATGLAQLAFTSGSLQRLIALSGGERAVFTSLAQALRMPGIRGVPQEAIGALLLIGAFGLLWRSRLAWVLTFLLTLATVSLELSPLSSASHALIYSNVALLALLLAFRRSFNRASLATGTLFALTGILFTLGYGILGSYVLGRGFRPKITNVVDAIYFAVVTMSTVGYGDITPQTAAARLFCVSLIVLGLVVFLTSLTAIVGPIVDNRLMRLVQPKRKQMKRVSHIVVVGDGPLARAAVKSLESRGLHATAIVLAQPAEGAASPADLIVGDGSDSEVLRGANIEQARALLALSDDDSYNAFAILAAKELNAALRTVAAVNDAGKASRVARAHPDVLLALPQLGSELIAMALSGEEIRADGLVTELLKLG